MRLRITNGEGHAIQVAGPLHDLVCPQTWVEIQQILRARRWKGWLGRKDNRWT